MMSSEFGCVPDEDKDTDNSSVTVSLSLTVCDIDCFINQLNGYCLLDECIEEV
ncbi:hypothetical protein ES705_30995 [subsurface metagenome]